MKRLFTYVLASLCVLAAAAQQLNDQKVNTPFESSAVKLNKSGDGIYGQYNDGHHSSGARRVSTQSGYKYLGQGTFTDNFFGGTANVEIWQSSSNSSFYRVVNPYDGITNASGATYNGADCLDLIVMQPGATLGDITITKSDLVLFDGIFTGEHNTTYDGDIWIYHPFMFSSLSEESSWTYNKVLSYQDSGIPSQIQLAPYYYMEGVGGWNNTQKNGVVTITFPGTELPDPYFVSVTCDNTNLSSLTKNDKLKFHTTFGNNGSEETYFNTIVILNEQKNKIVALGNLELTAFPAHGKVSVDHEYALDTIQPGNYYATVMYFDWDNGWTYNSSYFKAMTVKDDIVLVEKITLSQTSATLSPESTLQLTATVLPSNATNKTVSWTTSSSTVATVSSSGLITAKAAGTATITCAATDGSGVKATCTVTVTGPQPDPYIQSVVCNNPDPANIPISEKVSISATFWNDGASGNVYTWPVLCTLKGSNNDIDKIIVDGDLSVDYFKASANTTVNYELAVDTIQPGTYYATVLCYDMAEEKWYYSGSKMAQVTIARTGSTPDVNRDGYVNGTDLVALVNIILGRSSLTTGDVNGDGKVNGTDYVALANYILGRSSNARGENAAMAETQADAAAYLSVDAFSINPGEESELVVALTNPYDNITLVQFDLELPDGLALKKYDGSEYDIDIAGRTTYRNHSLDASETDGVIRFLLSSTKNTPLSGSEGGIITMKIVADANYNPRSSNGIGVKNILLVTPEEKEIKPEDFYVITVGITDVVAKTEDNAPVYSLSGQRLAAPQKGINIVGGKKLMVK